MRSTILALVCICIQHGAIINGLPNHSYNRLESSSLQRRMHDVESIKEVTPVIEHKTLQTERLPSGRVPAKTIYEKAKLSPIAEENQRSSAQSEIEEIELVAVQANGPLKPLDNRVINGKASIEFAKKKGKNALKAEKSSQEVSLRASDPNSPLTIMEIQHGEEWTEKNLDVQKMMYLSGLLGIHPESDYVELITKESYYHLNSFLRKSKSSEKMLHWYKEASLTSLSTLSQKILKINLKYTKTQPWWSRENLNTWEWYDRDLFSGNQLFQLSIVQIGEILRLGENEVEPTLEEIETMKSDLIDVFKTVPHIIVEPSTRKGPVFPTILADELNTVTQQLPGESLFSKRIQSLGLKNEERSKFSDKFFDPHVTDKELMGPVIDTLTIQWLIHGWSPKDGYTVTSTLRKLIPKSNINLLKNIKKSSEVLNLISPNSWIKNGKLSTQTYDLIEFYSKVLNKPEILKKVWVYEWLVYVVYKVFSFPKLIWRSVKSKSSRN